MLSALGLYIHTRTLSLTHIDIYIYTKICRSCAHADAIGPCTLYTHTHTHTNKYICVYTYIDRAHTKILSALGLYTHTLKTYTNVNVYVNTERAHMQMLTALGLYTHTYSHTHSLSVTQIYVYIYRSCEYADSTGWRRLIGCLKLQIIFCKRATNYRALLRKMTYEDKPSYASSPPCIGPGTFNTSAFTRTHTHTYMNTCIDRRIRRCSALELDTHTHTNTHTPTHPHMNIYMHILIVHALADAVGHLALYTKQTLCLSHTHKLLYTYRYVYRL